MSSAIKSATEQRAGDKIIEEEENGKMTMDKRKAKKRKENAVGPEEQ